MAARIGEEVVIKTMKRLGFLKEGRACCEKTKHVPLFLCAHRPDRGGLLEKMPDGGLQAGWGGLFSVKYFETKAAYSGQLN